MAKSKSSKIFLFCTLVLTLLVGGLIVGAFAASAAEEVSYIDFTDQNGTLAKETQTVSDYTLVTSATTELSDGYFVVSGEVTLAARLQVKGIAHLILKDGAHLVASYGIGVNGDECGLYIYAQSESESTMGKLTATASMHDAGIGTDRQALYMGDIVINGGRVSATGGADGAGIGHGYSNSVQYGSIIINGGIVNAVGGANSAGIGASRKTAVKNIVIRGGAVTATGSPGIGSLFYEAEIAIVGGTVTATGVDDAVGIGCGKDSSGGRVTITGGSVTAVGDERNVGIGVAGDGQIELIYVTAADVSSKNEAGEDAIGCTDGLVRGMLLRKGEDIVISGTVTLPNDFVVAEDERLVIASGATLNVPEGVELVNNGTLYNSGLLQIDGAFSNNGEFECEDAHTYQNCRCYCGFTKHQTGTFEFTNGFCPNGCYQTPKKVSYFYYNYLCETHEGYYVIENQGMLFWFAQLVNGALADGTPQNTAANAILVKSLDLGGATWYPIGLYHDPAVAGGLPVVAQYTGHFDGRGATVSNFIATGNGAQGLFGYCGDTARIEYLGVTTAAVRGENAGAIVGYGSQLINCFARDCIITGASDTNTGPVSISALGANGQGRIQSCYAYNCTLVIAEGETQYVMRPVAGAGGGNVQNTYYCEILTEAVYTSLAGATALTSEQLGSGEAAYLLNGLQNAGFWKQELGDDDFPRATSDAQRYDSVYRGYLSCDESESAVYTNDKTIAVTRPAHVDENCDHICDNGCGASEVGEHSDSASDADHLCDHGCGAVLEACYDKDKSHACDACGTEMNGELHLDAANDADHLCDYGCGAVLEGCADGDKDHVCDVCGESVNQALHSDGADADHLCDYGCGAVVTPCADANKDGICDVCGAQMPKKGLTAGAVVGIVIGSVALGALGGFALWWFVIKKRK